MMNTYTYFFTVICCFLAIGQSSAQNINWPPDYDGIMDSQPWGYEDMLLCTNDCHNPNADYSEPEWNTDHNGYPSPDSDYSCIGTGRPTSTCPGFGASYVDQYIEQCGGGYKLVRRWTAWCNGQLSEHNQLIKVVDSNPPQLECPRDITMNAGGHGCEGSGYLPEPWVTGGCGGSEELTVTVSAGYVTRRNGRWYVENLPVGTHTATWTANDGCNNSSSCSYQITASDYNSPPVAVCERNLWVSLTGDHTLVYASTFDDGSHDDCGQVYFKASRDGDPFDDHVKFTCEDAGKVIWVTLRVYDVNPGYGEVNPWRHEPGEDLYGHYNDCMIEVQVKDKLNPHFYCPPDIWADCNDDLGDLSDYGDIMQGGGACGHEDYHVEVHVEHPEDCSSYGRMYQRHFTVRDAWGKVVFQCTQRIKLKDHHPFEICDTECRDAPVQSLNKVCWSGGHSTQDGVEWPCDLHLERCMADLSPESLMYDSDPNVRRNAKPQFFNDHCAQLAWSYKDQEFDFGSEGCRKIIRTWSVIDWCQFEVTDRRYGEFKGLWRYIQIIAVKDKTEPTIQCPSAFNANLVDPSNRIANGSFSAGDNGFTSKYDAPRGQQGSYRVGPMAWILDAKLDGVDHTTGDGDYLMARADSSGNAVWCQTVTVNPGTNFTLSGWVNNLAPDTVDAPKPNLLFTVNGRNVIETGDVSSLPDEWVQFSGNWPSLTSTTAEICISATEGSGGAYFGIDDLSFKGGKQCLVNPRDPCEFYANIPTPDVWDNCEGDLELKWHIDLNSNDAWNNDITGTGNASQFLPEGNHRIKWVVEDACGNEATCISSFTVSDCKKPTPYCDNGIAIVVMPSTGAIEVWANDLDEGSFDNCTPKKDLKFYIRRSDSGDPWETALTLSCDDLPSGYIDTVFVDMQVVDRSGNSNYCRTYILLQDTPDENGVDACPDAEDLEGKVETRSSTANVFILEQNTPNPFTEETTVQWRAHADGIATILVRDLRGQIVVNTQENVLSGLNQTVLNLSNITPGVYYYTIELEGNKATKKMIKI